MTVHDVRTNCVNRATIVLMVGIALAICFSSKSSRADQQLPLVTIGFQSGTITAIYESQLQIDGRTFSLSPDAILQDDRGREIEASALVVSAEVKYRMKKERNDMIDRMMVIFPR